MMATAVMAARSAGCGKSPTIRSQQYNINVNGKSRLDDAKRRAKDLAETLDRNAQAMVITCATRRQVRRATGAFERRPSCQNSCRRPIHEEQ